MTCEWSISGKCLQERPEEIQREKSNPDLAHGLGVNEMVIAPDAGVIIVFPLRVDIKVGEMVTLWDGELLPHLVTLFLSTL